MTNPPAGPTPDGRRAPCPASGRRGRVCAGAPPQGAERSTGRRRGRQAVAALCVLTVLVMLLHRWIPNRIGNLGSLVETFLPWTGAVVLPAALAGLVSRSRPVLIAVLLPALTWTALYAPALLDRGTGGTGGTGGTADLTVVTHNVDDANPDPVGTARALAASGAGLIALEELVQPAVRQYEQTLAETHPYHVVEGTVGLWSTFPLRDPARVQVTSWRVALRATAETPEGPLTVYVAHLPSVRVRPSGFTTANRNEAVGRLATALDTAPPGRTLLVGDFNGTTDDRALAPVVDGFRSAHEAAGAGFGFSWPARLPFARIDQILVRGLTPVSAWTLPATASDHLPVAASLRL
ncbi:endonuclease/exonuclease/phosphatase family protein [Streptomyces sp. NPDC057011]|uniref:endonuclease/exonuclease/phosphatase family protein n=1 Tax=unclassified Streptomyces TaxID=2593676 RepID=UPI0036390629